MDKKVFQPVGVKSEDTRHSFEDSSGKIYHFVGEHRNKENILPESDDDMDGRNETCENGEEPEDSFISSR